MSDKDQSTRERRAQAFGLGLAGLGATKHVIGTSAERKAFARIKRDSKDIQAARNKFRTLKRVLRRDGAAVNPLNPDMKRVAFGKNRLDEGDLRNLGFEEVGIAIPEAGQSRIKSYRHPASNFHIHDHGKKWVMHEDAHAAFPMQRRLRELQRSGKPIVRPDGSVLKLKKKISNKDILIGGTKHMVTEGTLGLVNYAKNRLIGGAPMLEAVNQELSSNAKRALNRVGKRRSRGLTKALNEARSMRKGSVGGILAGLGIAGANEYSRRKRLKDRQKVAALRDKYKTKVEDIDLHLQRNYGIERSATNMALFQARKHIGRKVSST